ncbi:hypothetical protein BASA81_010235 [Batrachochytrium salamandrivorans]|nr:hypothetical protein BASA81_010235 [Batrachochytrium salamandrivorans]
MIRNREAANVQLTAEQLIYDAKTQFSGEGGSDLLASQKDEQWKILDRDELNQFLQRKRKDYEDRIRKDRKSARSYLDYARFEAKQNDFRRARSIFERALTLLSGNALVWLAYAEIEAKAGFVAHAVNVLHRAVELLPRENKLWFQYALYQETSGVGNAGGVEETRQVFERWMRWLPPHNEPWFAYAAFEERHGALNLARDVYERFCGSHPVAKAYIKFAKWEEHHGQVDRARQVLERAVGAQIDPVTDQELPSELPSSELCQPDVWLAFAQFEVRQREPDRARAVYQFALEQVTQDRSRVFASFASFEKKLVESNTISSDMVVAMRRRNDYLDLLQKDVQDYDSWLDLCRLEETFGLGNCDKVRETYAQAQSHLPAQQEKRFWRRFVYLFVFESLFEELVMKDLDRAASALGRGLKVVPHKHFTFAKLWVLAANLELRRKNLPAARKLLGTSIGMCPKDKTFRTYIQLELQLGQVERCRLLYEKYLCWAPTNSKAWAKYAEMERNVGEVKRARTLFELGVSQPVLDEPEKLWLRYIDFELGCEGDEEEGEDVPAVDRARALYVRLVDRTEGKAAKVWIAYGKFLHANVDTVQARLVFEQAEEACREVPDQRALVAQARADLELSIDPTSDHSKDAQSRLPTRVDKLEEGTGAGLVAGWLFPRDVEEQAKRDASNEATKKSQAALRLMQLAQLHKKQKLEEQ